MEGYFWINEVVTDLIIKKQKLKSETQFAIYHPIKIEKKWKYNIASLYKDKGHLTSKDDCNELK